MVGLLGAVSALARRLELSAEVARKGIHVGLGLYCLSFPWLFNQAWQVWLLSALALTLLMAVRTSRALRAGLGHGLFSVARQSYGDVLFAVAVALTFLLSKGVLVAYLMPIAILTLSDAAAALVGSQYGRKLFVVEQGRKSWEGVAMFFLTAWLVALLVLLLASEASRGTIVLLSFIVAVYGTSVEATSWRGLDNLFVPIALCLLLVHHLDASLFDLGVGAALFVGALVCLWLVGRWFGLGGHAAYFFASLLATIAMATATWNIVLPAALLGLYGLVRPRPRQEQALSFGLALLGLILFWYALAEATGYSTAFAYNISLATFGAGLMIVHDRVQGGFLGLIATLAIAYAIAQFGWGAGPDRPDLLIAAFAVPLVMCVGFVLARGWFARAPAPRTAAVALLVGLAKMPLVQKVALPW
jgi:dolichol kinase